jgi:plastocyanin
MLRVVSRTTVPVAMRHTKRPQAGLAIGLAAITTGTLALVPHAPARGQPLARAAATTIHVTAKEFSLSLSTKSLARPGNVTFSVANAGHMAHNFRINGKQTPLIRPGKTSKLVVTFKKKGSYHYLCTVPGHAAAGMKGVLAVR